MNPRLCKDTGQVLDGLKVYDIQKPCDYPKPPNEFIDADWCRVKIGKELLFTFGGVLSGISPITLTVDESNTFYKFWQTPFGGISTPCGTLRIYFQITNDGGTLLQVTINGVGMMRSVIIPRVCQTYIPGDPTEFIFPLPLVDGSPETGFGPEFEVTTGSCLGTGSVTVTNANSGGTSYSSSTHVQYSLAIKTHQHKETKELWAAADCQADYDRTQEYIATPCCPIAKVPKYITITFGGDWAFLGSMVLTYKDHTSPLGYPGWQVESMTGGNPPFPFDPRYPNSEFCRPDYVSFACTGHQFAGQPDDAADYIYMLFVGYVETSFAGYFDVSPFHRCDDFSDINMANDFTGTAYNPCNIGAYTASIRFGLTTPIGPAPFDPPAISGSGFGRPLYTLALFTGQIKNGLKNYTAENDRCCMGGLLQIGTPESP